MVREVSKKVSVTLHVYMSHMCRDTTSIPDNFQISQLTACNKLISQLSNIYLSDGLDGIMNMLHIETQLADRISCIRRKFLLN